MDYFVMLLLAALLAAALVLLWRSETRRKAIQSQLLQLEQQPDRETDQVSAVRDAVWDCANTIHLYAALTEEESRSASIRERQAVIMDLSEEIRQLLQK